MAAGGAAGAVSAGSISNQVSSRGSAAHRGRATIKPRASSTRSINEFSQADRQTIGQRLTISPPGRKRAHQQGGGQNSAKQGPLIATRQGQRQGKIGGSLPLTLGQGDAQVQQRQAQ